MVVKVIKSISNHNLCQTQVYKHICCKGNKIYIKPQLFYSMYDRNLSCKGNKIYIKPQPSRLQSSLNIRCKGNKIYIKPQLIAVSRKSNVSCKGNKIYIKPQLYEHQRQNQHVVKVIKSISNHNPQQSNYLTFNTIQVD